MSESLEIFHPFIQAWFRENLGAPTDIQRQAWPIIAGGSHILLTAPTGSGKTLTAFLYSLNRFLSGAWEPGVTRILYVSPLKALNNDVQRNLIAPLEAIAAYFERAGQACPKLRVMVRSGDTPASERRRMLRHPPEILITTPESLNLLLLSESGRESLRNLSVVILDEIHAVAGGKRGVHLITAVDRLVPLAGEFQRIALSATVRPLETMAAWVGGYRLTETGYLPRPVAMVVSRTPKSYQLQVGYPGAAAVGDESSVWSALAERIRLELEGARSTLIFTNNRRLAERMARLLNERESVPIAYAHHGSLAKEIRAVVEERMKQGRLKAVVATNSLELGIDIGALDQVILVQTPFSVASGLQKIGRAGHGVGQDSRGLLLASHARDALDAAVAVKCMLAADIEAMHPCEGPLDMLAQILIAVVATGTWSIDGLYAFIRTSHPYRRLTRKQFDLTVDMLAGRFEATRVRELRPRISVDAVDGSVRALAGAGLTLALGGGSIPDRGYFTLRHAGSRAKIGELDEEFVWERRVGDTFGLGSQSWRISAITANEVEVSPAGHDAVMAPFWRAEARDRGFHFSLRLGEFLESADLRLEDPDLLRELREDCFLDASAAEAVLSLLRRQRAATRTSLPHRRHLVVEDAGDAPGNGNGGNRQVILHSLWGGCLNRPWAYALAAAYELRTGLQLEIIPGDDCILIHLPSGENPADLLEWAHADNLEDLLRRHLEKTGYFAAHFRENAARALLLPRSNLRSRVPLWLSRIRSGNLLQAVSGFADFPIVLETWRECLRDEFDLPALKAMLGEIHSGAIRISICHTAEPSPFSQSLMWKQTNKFMYQGSQPATGSVGPREDLLREIAFSSPLRPRIPGDIIADFEAKAQRTAEGYAPQTAREWVDWAKERVLIPWSEWNSYQHSNNFPRIEPDTYLETRLAGFRFSDADAQTGGFVAAMESLPRLWEALEISRDEVVLFSPLSLAANSPPRLPSPEALEILDGLCEQYQDKRQKADSEGPELAPLIAQWLRFYGPRPLGFIRNLFGRAFPKVEEALAELMEGDRIISDHLSENFGTVGQFTLSPEATEATDATEVCDADNLEFLLRLMRRRSRQAFQTLPVERYPLFLATWQGLTDPAEDSEGLQSILERLFGFPASVSAWESDILPARMLPYRPAYLDELFRDTPLAWIGCGPEKITFTFPEDGELFPVPEDESDAVDKSNPGARVMAADPVLDLLTQASPSRMAFQDLTLKCPLPSDRITASLWSLAWRGRITNDTYAALRKGVESGFKMESPAAPGANGKTGRRGQFAKWRATRPSSGNWRILKNAPSDSDPLELEEIAKDRVRQLLRRYGLLFRGILEYELPALHWSAVFRALRLLELSGEVLSGHFFAGLSGLQFITPPVLGILTAKPAEDAVYWMSAIDPASPCALGLEALPYSLPSRLASTQLVFHGTGLVLVSRRSGRDLTLNVDPGHKYLTSYLTALRNPVERAVLPSKAVEVETINGESATESPYLDALLVAGFKKGFKTLTLRKRH